MFDVKEIPKDHGFGINNLPYGIFSPKTELDDKRIGVAIGDYILDLKGVRSEFVGQLWDKIRDDVFSHRTLNKFMALTQEHWTSARAIIKTILIESKFQQDINLIHKDKCQLHLPVDIGDYTDFYASIDHATNIGTIIRGPENALNDNFLHLPVAYHGRASSIVVSGTTVRRPSGQYLPVGAKRPVFGPCKALDFELEMGCFIGGKCNKLGEPIPVANAEENLFGLVLLNDWSARDIQKWEYQPLGPFLSKNFCSTISPWIVTFEALKEFKVPNREQKFEPLPYLKHDDQFNFDIKLEVLYKTPTLSKPQSICKSNFKHLYWTVKQMLAHHTITGCQMKPGDMLGTGTLSGPEESSRACMIEMSMGGKKPIEFEEDKSKRFYMEDGDTVELRAYCESANGERVSFGSCVGTIVGQ